MVNLIQDKDLILKTFSKNINSLYLEYRFGIKNDVSIQDILLSNFKEKLLTWQLTKQIESAPVTNIRIITNLPISQYRDPSHCISKVEIDKIEDTSLVEIQTDNCITKINIGSTGVGFVFTQDTLSNHWVINHKLNYKPNVYLEDNDGNIINGIITHIDTNNLVIDFSSPVSGKAYLS